VIDPVQLQALGISAEELLSSLQRNNRLIAAGNVDTGRGSFAIKIPSVIESAEDILSIPIKANASGVISLRDVVVLSETFKDASSYTRTNGQAAIAIEVSKRAGVSLVDVVAGVREAVELTRLDLPRAVQIDYIADQ
jgi:multidrug efflux pump